MAKDAKTKEAPAEKAEAPAKTVIMKVVKQPEKAFRGSSARGQYWDRFQKYSGKSLAELEESCQKEPPSTPKKGNLAGKVEPFGGWVSFFKQQGLISLSEK